MTGQAEVVIVVPAAGRSRRMGRSKPLVPYRGRPMLEWVLAAATASSANGIVVVLGRQADRIRPLAERFGAQIVVNPDPDSEMVDSVRLGLEWITARTPRPAGLMLCLADQPDIPTAAIEAVLAEFRRQPQGIVVAAHRGRRGHPVVFSLDCAAELRGLGPGQGANELLRRHPEAVREVEVGTAAVLRDVDRPEDLAGPAEGCA